MLVVLFRPFKIASASSSFLFPVTPLLLSFCNGHSPRKLIPGFDESQCRDVSTSLNESQHVGDTTHWTTVNETFLNNSNSLPAHTPTYHYTSLTSDQPDIREAMNNLFAEGIDHLTEAASSAGLSKLEYAALWEEVEATCVFNPKIVCNDSSSDSSSDSSLNSSSPGSDTTLDHNTSSSNGTLNNAINNSADNTLQDVSSFLLDVSNSTEGITPNSSRDYYGWTQEVDYNTFIAIYDAIDRIVNFAVISANNQELDSNSFTTIYEVVDHIVDFAVIAATSLF